MRMNKSQADELAGALSLAPSEIARQHREAEERRARNRQWVECERQVSAPAALTRPNLLALAGMDWSKWGAL